MSEPDITPLARRLAEQNNVDWRRLQGSGDGGRIVERDVLDYLARVMAGEEAVDPTPEPLPEGMDAWPEQDIATVRQGVGEAATLGELRHEIGSAVREEPAAVDEDVFLFDDEPEAAETPAPAPAPAPREGAAPTAADDLDDLLVSGDEPLPVDDGAGRDDALGPAPAPGAAAAPAQGAEEAWGEGIHLGEPSPREETPPSDIWGEPVGRTSDDVDLFAVSSEAEEGASGGDAGSDADLWAAPEEPGAPAGAAASADETWAEAPAERGDSPYDAWSAGPSWEPAGTGEGPAEGGGRTGDADDGGMPQVGGDAGQVGAADDGHALEDVGAAGDRAAAEGAGDAGAVVGEEAAPVDAADAPADAAADLESGPGEVVAAVETPDELAGVTQAGFEGLPLARLRLALRRHVDVSALAGAQLAVSQELGHEEPLGAAPFVLRAVAKAAAELGGGFGQVALAAFGDGVSLRRVDGAADRPFAEIVSELAGPGVEEDEAGLVVADLSGLDVDEVVLDLDLPVLSLGRILYDNQRGGYRSTLTLAGDLPAETGARLLARVAELLDSPVRLVM
ncbi:MAG TPA: E3 binding domain-containing protein [Trueperaceae bacterium]